LTTEYPETQEILQAECAKTIIPSVSLERKRGCVKQGKSSGTVAFWAISKVKEVKNLNNLNNQYENLPPELRNIKTFCCWRYEKVKGEIQKIPYNPVTGKRARPNQPNTFKDFDSALAAAKDYDGIGFLVGNGICGIDLDDCFDSVGKLKALAQSVVNAFIGCYMEHSPSGKGLHIY
jgi:Uncharacterized conserved protein